MSNKCGKNTGKHNAESQDLSSCAEKVKNLGGRPTLYKPEYIEVAREYFSEATYNEKYKCWQFPSRVFFAKRINVGLQTVRDWEEVYPEFGEVMAEGIEHSKELRILFAENDRINGSFSKFVLASAYGMSEKQTIDIGQKDDKAWEVSVKVVK